MKRDLPLNVIQEEALFSSAHAALTFALNFSSQQFGKSAMATLIAPAGGSGKGLGGLDGSAQAGIVRAELERCGILVESLLIARVAPKVINCDCMHSCCSGKKPNIDYEKAISYLTDESACFFSGCLSLYSIRRACILKYFGEKIKFKDVADTCSVNEKTVYSNNERILKWLKGESRDSPGQEAKAWQFFEDKLRTAGLID